MAKKRKTIKRLSTQGELVARTRRMSRVEGTINGATKVIIDKSTKRKYSRREANNPKNWE